MESRINLYDVNLNRINIEAIGLIGLKLIVSSPSYTTESVQTDSGQTIVLSKTLNPRQLEAEFMTVSDTYENMLKQKHELYALLGNGEEIYIEQSHRKGIVWKCHLNDWIPDLIGTSVTTFSVPLDCLSGMSSTLNMITKTFTTNTFTFKNEGNQTIDPRTQKSTNILFKGASNNLKITNTTTGESWIYNGTTTENDVIKIAGIESFKNDINIFAYTNKKILTLAAGNNIFTVSGASGSFEITISTRFLFL